VARLAVLASGNGSNFEAIVEYLRRGSPRDAARGSASPHECVLLLYDRRAAFAATRAARLGVKARYVTYAGRSREEAEAEIEAALEESGTELIALAGFMRLLSPTFVRARYGRIVNVHPSLLPKWPGARAIERAYQAGEREFGVTVHLVDEGMDTGPLVDRASFLASADAGLEAIEAWIHDIEHQIYPKAVAALLDAIEAERGER
jgi:phosphoribosylglycinamide formyltransferase 1